MIEITDPTPCKVENDKVKPCLQLSNAFGDIIGRDIFLTSRINFKTKKTRTTVVIKTGRYKKNPTELNYCPFCGTPIKTS